MTIGERSLTRFGRMLMLVIPLALVLASLGGYWLSGRALAPVTQITNDARRINATNLSDRLAVPPAHDELRELSETLNAMLGRIDRSVSQLRQFTADASHELRAPLALIYTAAEFSLRRERPREELVEALEKILRESRHTASLVDSLLLLARADSGEDSLQAPVVDQFVGRSVRTLRIAPPSSPSAKGISVSTDLGSTSIVVDGDETALRRLLLILVDNAIKYTPAGGRVDVRLAARWRAPRSFAFPTRGSVSPPRTCRMSSTGSGAPTKCDRERRAAPAWGWRSRAGLSTGTVGRLSSRARSVEDPRLR